MLTIFNLNFKKQSFNNNDKQKLKQYIICSILHKQRYACTNKNLNFFSIRVGTLK